MSSDQKEFAGDREVSESIAGHGHGVRVKSLLIKRYSTSALLHTQKQLIDMERRRSSQGEHNRATQCVGRSWYLVNLLGLKGRALDPTSWNFNS